MGVATGDTATLCAIEPERRRRLQLIAAALLAVMLVATGVVVALNQDNEPNLVSASDTRTTTTVRREAAAVVVSTTQPPAVVVVATTGAAARPRPVATTTTQVEFADVPAKLECVRTTPAAATPTPQDWSTYWTEEPDPNQNEGLGLVICVEDRTPKVGETVKLYVLADDPDAEIGTGECDIHVSWDSNSGSLCRDTVVAPGEPKPPPKAKHGRVRMTYIHQYDEPGEWIIDVSAWSGPDRPERHPYASYNSIELRVNAHR